MQPQDPQAPPRLFKLGLDPARTCGGVPGWLARARNTVCVSVVLLCWHLADCRGPKMPDVAFM